MDTFFKRSLDKYSSDERLAVAANLLSDVVFVGWIAFAGLYAIEVLLPTFVTARLSLVKFAILLLGLTSLLIWLSQSLAPTKQPSKKILSRPLLILFAMVSIGIIALAHYRFPWWSIPIIVSGYSLVLWLFFRPTRDGH
jgi:phosphatidylserine synthase